MNKVRYHLQSIDSSEEEKRMLETELLESTKIRNGYISKAVSVITSLAKQYNAVIVFENLDHKAGTIKGITLFSEQPFKEVSSKDKRMYTGLSPYQLLQNKIIQKCNYYLQKDSNSEAIQTTPRLKRIDDMKQLTLMKQKNCAR